eukprot:scaffold5742_cov61-Phaeocystis_antarctica.AAC.2
MDGELGARERAARPPGQSAGCRGARRRAPLIGTHGTVCASLPVAAAHRRRPSRCAGGWPASSDDDGALRQRPRGVSGARRHRVRVLPCRRERESSGAQRLRNPFASRGDWQVASGPLVVLQRNLVSALF